MGFQKGILSFLVVAGSGLVCYGSDKLTLDQLAFGYPGTDTESINGFAFFAGPLNATLDGAKSVQVYSADIFHAQVFTQPTNVSVENTLTLGANYQFAAQLYNAFASTVGIDALKNAGLQAAIWKAVYPSIKLSDYLQVGVTAQANAYLSSDVSGYSKEADYYDFAGENQAMLGAYQPAAVPEPSAYSVLCLGLFVFLRPGRRTPN